MNLEVCSKGKGKPKNRKKTKTDQSRMLLFFFNCLSTYFHRSLLKILIFCKDVW